ncbi:MAG: hypothetical protein ACRDBO_03905 [Lachnospiraceae bacterium]
MSQLPLFTKNDCIKNSVNILKEGWHYAVLNHEVLNEEYRNPENMIWQVAEPNAQKSNSDPSILQVENPVTGQKMLCLDKNFVGALRPDIVSGIEFEELKKEYEASKSIPWNCEELAMESGDEYGL